MPARVDKEGLVAAILACLAVDHEKLGLFLDTTGQDVSNLRRVVAEEPVQNGLIDFMLADEALLIAVAADLGLAPQLVGEAASRMRMGAVSD